MQKLSRVLLGCFMLVNNCFGMEESLSIVSQEHIRKLESAIFSHKHDKTKKIIESNSMIVNVDMPSEDSLFKLLHCAVEKDNIFATELFLKMNVSANIKTIPNNYTPLHMARSKAVIKLLLKYGADLNSADKRGYTPLYHMLFYFNSYYYYRYDKVNFDQRYNMAYFLLKKGADINQIIDNQDNTLLYEAVFNNCFGRTQFLLDHGVNTELKDVDGKTALEIAIKNWSNRQECLRAFRSKGIFFMPRGAGNLFGLLKNKAEKFKKVMTAFFFERRLKVENGMADFFITIQKNKNSMGNGAIIKHDGKGYCFKNVSFNDLEQWVGEDAVDYVKKYLTDRCLQALSLAKNNDYSGLSRIVRGYSYVLFYDGNIAFDLLYHVMMNNEEFCGWLLPKCFDVNRVDKDTGDMLLLSAIAHKKAYAIESLIKNNVSLITWNTSFKSCLAVLHQIKDKDCIDSFNNAFINKFFSTYSYQPYYHEIKYVLKKGFDLNICDKEGKSLLLKAVQSYPEKCSLLLKCGAVITQEIIDNACSVELRTLLEKRYKEGLI